MGEHQVIGRESLKVGDGQIQRGYEGGQLAQARLHHRVHAIDRFGIRPAVALFPLFHGGARLTDLLGNRGHAPSLKEQAAREGARIGGE